MMAPGHARLRALLRVSATCALGTLSSGHSPALAPQCAPSFHSAHVFYGLLPERPAD